LRYSGSGFFCSIFRFGFYVQSELDPKTKAQHNSTFAAKPQRRHQGIKHCFV
jgi:hypothetical protein